MLKVTDTVLELIKADELALESARAKLLNFSAYAEKIHPLVENLTKKPVQKGTIVVALSRIAKSKDLVSSQFKPDIKLTNLSIKSSLSALTYQKTADIQRKISVLNPFQISLGDLFSLTEGPTEVTLILSENAKDKLIKQLATNPISEKENLVAITAQFDPKYADTPNNFFVLFSALAAKRISIVEVISTYKEISFIVNKENMESALSALNVYFSKV